MNFEDIGRQGTDRKSVIKVLIHLKPGTNNQLLFEKLIAIAQFQELDMATQLVLPNILMTEAIRFA